MPELAELTEPTLLYRCIEDGETAEGRERLEHGIERVARSASAPPPEKPQAFRQWFLANMLVCQASCGLATSKDLSDSVRASHFDKSEAAIKRVLDHDQSRLPDLSAHAKHIYGCVLYWKSVLLEGSDEEYPLLKEDVRLTLEAIDEYGKAANPDLGLVARAIHNLAHCHRRMSWAIGAARPELAYQHAVEAIQLYLEVQFWIEQGVQFLTSQTIERGISNNIDRLLTHAKVDMGAHFLYNSIDINKWRRALCADLHRDFKNASLDELWDEFMAPAPEEAITRIEEIVRAAQKDKPGDIKTFVAKVNDIMLTKGLRFQLSGSKELARLKAGSNSIQFVKKGTTGGVAFLQEFQVVYAPDRPSARHAMNTRRDLA